MKKVLGLCAVIMLSSVSVVAQEKQNRRGHEREREGGQRFERLAERLKMDEKQTAEFQKLNESMKDKMKAEQETMKAEREQMKAMREKRHDRMMAMQNERSEEMKKILTEEQFKQYQAMHKPKFDKRSPRDAREKGRERGERAHRRGPRFDTPKTVG
ncbi:hypothetical protein LJC38_02280 [Parabacteroides sp. OttesenSCG-928-K15]|nr:hypothetical protein [Parabacteroides sp. OttesenSCG-928-K15]